MRKIAIALTFLIVAASTSYYFLEIHSGNYLIEDCKKQVQKSISVDGVTAFVHLIDCGAMDSPHTTISLAAAEQYDKSTAKVVAVFGGAKIPMIKWNQNLLIVTHSPSARSSFKLDKYKETSIIYETTAVQ